MTVDRLILARRSAVSCGLECVCVCVCVSVRLSVCRTPAARIELGFQLFLFCFVISLSGSVNLAVIIRTGDKYY